MIYCTKVSFNFKTKINMWEVNIQQNITQKELVSSNLKCFFEEKEDDKKITALELRELKDHYLRVESLLTLSAKDELWWLLKSRGIWLLKNWVTIKNEWFNLDSLIYLLGKINKDFVSKNKSKLDKMAQELSSWKKSKQVVSFDFNKWELILHENWLFDWNLAYNDDEVDLDNLYLSETMNKWTRAVSKEAKDSVDNLKDSVNRLVSESKRAFKSKILGNNNPSTETIWNNNPFPVSAPAIDLNKIASDKADKDVENFLLWKKPDSKKIPEEQVKQKETPALEVKEEVKEKTSTPEAKEIQKEAPPLTQAEISAITPRQEVQTPITDKPKNPKIIKAENHKMKAPKFDFEVNEWDIWEIVWTRVNMRDINGKITQRFVNWKFKIEFTWNKTILNWLPYFEVKDMDNIWYVSVKQLKKTEALTTWNNDEVTEIISKYLNKI